MEQQHSTQIEPQWLSLSEETNALGYLEKAYLFILKIEAEAISWKWVILALYGALYGFAISALRGTHRDRVTYETKKKEEKLISFDEAIKRVQKPCYMHMTVVSKHLELHEQQKESIRRLQEVFRNNFIHYVPTSWLIEIHEMPQIAIDCLDIIRFLALDTGNYVHLNTQQKRRVSRIVREAKRFLKRSQLFQEMEHLERQRTKVYKKRRGE